MTLARSIAVAQTIPRRGDIGANLERHVRLARLAAEAHANVLVFPELSLTGYELDLARDLAFSPEDPRLDPLVETACSLGLTLIAGAPVRIESRLHIGAFIISPDRAVGLYTKHHLGAFPASASCDGVVPPEEASVFDPGDLDPLVRIGDQAAAVAVCADTSHETHSRAAANRGAKSYLASMFVIPSDFKSATACLAACAGRHAMVVACSNYGGPSGGLASAGRSAIWTETGERLTQLEPSGAGIALATETATGWRAIAFMLDDD